MEVRDGLRTRREPSRASGDPRHRQKPHWTCHTFVSASPCWSLTSILRRWLLLLREPTFAIFATTTPLKIFFIRLLPVPVYSVPVEDDVEETIPQPSQSLITRNPIPPYGQRVGWKPSTPDDFGA